MKTLQKTGSKQPCTQEKETQEPHTSTHIRKYKRTHENWSQPHLITLDLWVSNTTTWSWSRTEHQGCVCPPEGDMMSEDMMLSFTLCSSHSSCLDLLLKVPLRTPLLQGRPQASELSEVRVGLGGRRAAALCSVRKL